MKPYYEYIRLALENWCKSNRLGRDLPVTPFFALHIMNGARDLYEADKKKLEAPEPPTV